MTFNKIKKYLLSAVMLTVSLWLSAQTGGVLVDCPQRVRAGQQFVIQVQVSVDNPSEPKFPEMTAFAIVADAGRGQSFSSSTDLSGKVKTVRNTLFSYIVLAKQAGTQTFPPVEVSAGGKKYRSEPVTVQVLPSSGGAAQGQNQTANAQQGQSQSGQSSNAADQSNDGVRSNNRDVFISVVPSRTHLYQGESLTASIKIYTKRSISGIGDFKPSTFDGFFMQELQTPQNINLERTTVGGEVYGAGTIKQYSLSPQKSGVLTINPSKMTVGVEKRIRSGNPFGNSFFDDFFTHTQTEAVELSSAPVKITVQPLPSEGKPASFTNGVGQLKMTAAIDRTEVKANDPVTLKITVSGTGNVRFVDAPHINFPPDFEVWEPKVNTSLNAASTSGSKTFEFVFVPRHGGTYQLPPVEFSYFDPQTKQYKTTSSSAYTITVEKGNEQNSGTTVVSGVSREELKYIGKDINYIKPVTALSKAGEHFFGTWLFWLWYVLATVAFVAIVYLRRKFISRYSDVAMVKNRRASRYASKRLKRARSFMNASQTAQFYEELSRALWGFLSDKLNIPVADLSRDNGKQSLVQHNVDEAQADAFMAVIDDCEFARYAPSAVGMDMKTLYGRAEEAINKMQGTIK